MTSSQFCAPRAIMGCDFAVGSAAAGTWPTSSVGERPRLRGVPSSTVGRPRHFHAIRRMLIAGQVCEASALLGRDHYVRVAWRCRGEGPAFGFPTANVVVPDTYAVLADGVYAGYVIVGGVRHPAAISVGTPPTFPDAPGRLECHILDFDGDLYGRDVEVVFVARLRDMMGFSTEEELIATVSANITWVSRHLR